ncbi:Stp1/IreP family PP2C-type Ser/Thr phosphatase [Labedella phragmitis]|uniref:Stp1/IreP family PP2C-type Ser/Thr phosphatase n=1 Tax=Labedella phragmitis TaxID=2498849 RepID=A0A3S3Z626_9MICO|nr:Stp1/IreP family PP2C-type Ser/Thr phosphatase [Labedella phragmitis]RWZ52632.1 Stp1/IreP family PP2C-type Ser/Thr phosphatase [Labedella phragmitis]
MEYTADSAAVSHVGKVRSNNQDSAYIGNHLFVVADGMGGHAGGDVASAIALQRILKADTEYSTIEEAQSALQSAIAAANGELAETVFEHPELTGMGTTVDAISIVGDQVVIAHIGDSRIYLYRDGELSQITTDHTFVQRLVDSGRITPDEARVHPRRSVLMRVLGDVDSAPEVDTFAMTTKPGDRWLLCSDGLSDFVDDADIEKILAERVSAKATGDRLVKLTLDHGAPDNVTAVILDIGETLPERKPVIVGSASKPLSFSEVAPKQRTGLIPAMLHSVRPSPANPSHFESDAEDYLEELIEEDARRAKRRRLAWLAGIVVIILAIGLALLGAYSWTQTRYYLGSDDDTVVIFQGIQQSVGPISLSSEFEDTGIPLSLLNVYDRQRIEQTVGPEGLAEIRETVERIKSRSGLGGGS